MEILFGAFIFLLGVVVGSFLNVVILRYNTGKTIGGRSACLVCNRVLKAIDLIPILSFLKLKGRCRRCKAPLSAQYPVVEFLGGILFLLSFTHSLPLMRSSMLWGSVHLLVLFILMSLLLVIGVYDIRHTIIPNRFVYAFASLSFLFLFFNAGVLAMPSFMDFLAGPLLALPFFLLWFLSGGRWMGLGDAKLALGIGWVLSLADGISALVFSFWLGAIWAGIVFLHQWILKKADINLTRKLNLKSELPFAPFLIVGFLIVFLGGITIPLLFF